MTATGAGGGDRPPVWTFRGYELSSGEFTTAMVHLFRAEISRANVWRQRLDATTNWAVITTGAAVSFAFSEALGHHSVILLNLLLVTLFLYIEARRYRYYELWSFRIRLMETDFFAAMLVPPFHPAPDWAESLAENLLQPHHPISMWEALGRRFRRNYLWIFAIMGLAWVLRLGLIPQPVESFADFLQRASLGPLSGTGTIVLLAVYYSVLMAIGIMTLRLYEATGEVLPSFGEVGVDLGDEEEREHRRGPRRAWFRPARRRRQFIALIVTDNAEAVAQAVLKDMRRGLTSLPGKGMYTGQPHSVLLCALTITEIPTLKALVRGADPRAFVIVSPAHEVLGQGFTPLEERHDD
jgi:uncharacterized membrane protein